MEKLTSGDWLYKLKWLKTVKYSQNINKNPGSFPLIVTQIFVSPFIFSFRVKLPWIFLSSASMVSPPISASRWVRFTMPMPNTISVTCWGSELTRLRRLPPAPGGLLGVLGSCCSFSKMTLQSCSEGRRPFSAESTHVQDVTKTAVTNLLETVCKDKTFMERKCSTPWYTNSFD